jgi:[acyl-carrier-protein] S-malonyltransferase
MGRRLAHEHAVARDALEEADDALGFALSRLCFEGPQEELVRTEYAQPAILAVSVATWRALEQVVALRPSWLAGHSLGEYTALVVGGALAFDDALRLVRTRGRLMQAAVPAGRGAMAAVFGLEEERVVALCREAAAGEVVTPANLNGAGQIVVAGDRAAVDRVVAAAQAAGGRALPLAVSAPFHCALMAPAADGLRRALADVAVTAPRLPIVANVDARPHADAAGVAERLVQQVTAPVRWAASMHTLADLGCRRALEVGPGQALTKMLQRMRLGIAAVTAGEARETWDALGADA